MGTVTQTKRATIEDLYHVPDNGKAEIVNGELILMPPTCTHTHGAPEPVGRWEIISPDAVFYGEIAEAEPAVPGWRFPVDDLFV